MLTILPRPREHVPARGAAKTKDAEVRPRAPSSQSSSLNSRAGAADHAGVVDQHVETAKPFERARHQRSRLGAAGQVGGERRRLHAVLRRDGGR